MTDYVDNVRLCDDLSKYRKDLLKAQTENTTLPKIPNYAGHCFIEISTRLANRYNFVNYTYKDEMIADGIENAVAAAHKFNPEITQNAFGYFTQIIFWAMVRRIDKEKKHSYIKHKSLEHHQIESMLHHGGDYGATVTVDLEKSRDLVDKFETKIKEAKIIKEKKSGVEVFYDKNDEGTI